MINLSSVISRSCLGVSRLKSDVIADCPSDISETNGFTGGARVLLFVLVRTEKELWPEKVSSWMTGAQVNQNLDRLEGYVMISYNFLIYSGVSYSWAERAWCLFTPGISIATGPATQVCVGSIFSSRAFPQVLNDAASLVPLLSASAGSRQDIGDLLFGPDPGVPASPIRQQAGYSSR